MRTLLSVACGPPSTLELHHLPDPAPGAGQVLVAIGACGINYPDVLMIEDRYQFSAVRPFAPGIEIAGLVERLGPGVSGPATGTRVAAQIPHGGLAEKVLVDVDRLHSLPSGVSEIRAASSLLTYATSYHALRDRAALRAGESLLILGAAGGVGLAAVELGKLMGARVVASVSSEAKARAAEAAGADEVLVYGQDGDPRALAAQFKRAAPAGFDVIYDPVGGAYAEGALRSIAWQGRYLVVGFPAGIPRPPLNLVLLKGCQIIGVFWGAAMERNPARARAIVAELFDLMAAGKLDPPPPRTYPLDRGGEAIEALGRREAVGKLVVVP